MTISLSELPEDLREWAEKVAEDWSSGEDPLDLSEEDLERRMKKVAKILVSPVPDGDPS